MPIQICPACGAESRYLIPCPHCGREHCPDCSPTQAAVLFSERCDRANGERARSRELATREEGEPAPFLSPASRPGVFAGELHRLPISS